MNETSDKNFTITEHKLCKIIGKFRSQISINKDFNNSPIAKTRDDCKNYTVKLFQLGLERFLRKSIKMSNFSQFSHFYK